MSIQLVNGSDVSSLLFRFSFAYGFLYVHEQNFHLGTEEHTHFQVIHESCKDLINLLGSQLAHLIHSTHYTRIQSSTQHSLTSIINFYTA
jgi:hypothetical protein